MITVYGASDDLIEVEGDITEEFPYRFDTDDETLLAFSDGTVLRIEYTDAGVWRISPVHRGSGGLTIDACPEGDGDNYSDRAKIEAVPAIAWVVHGVDIATKEPSPR